MERNEIELDAQGRTPCPDCGESFKPRGMTAHRKQHAVADVLRERNSEDCVRDVRTWAYRVLRGEETIPMPNGHGTIPPGAITAVAAKVLELTDR